MISAATFPFLVSPFPLSGVGVVVSVLVLGFCVLVFCL